MMKTSRKLTNLQAWQKAMDFAVLIGKEILPKLPKDEQYALTDQLRRAAQGIPANIAEGFGRHHYQDAVRFSYIARIPGGGIQPHNLCAAYGLPDE